FPIWCRSCGFLCLLFRFFFSSRRRHTRFSRDWSSDVCSSDLVTTGGALSALVVGIGINLVDRPVPPPLEATATSVEAELGRRCDRPALLTTLLGRLRLAVGLVHEGGRGAIIERWRWFARSGLGGVVRWHDAEGAHRGVARDVDDDGALLVSREGVVVRVVAGDVIWEGLSGA